MSKKAKHFNINGESIDVAVDWENVEGAPDIPSAASEISTDEGISDGKNVQADLTSLAQDISSVSSQTDELETTINGEEQPAIYTASVSVDKISSGYTNYYFAETMPKGSVITKRALLGNGTYLLKSDGTFFATLVANLTLPYTTTEDYVGLKVRVSQVGDMSLTYQYGTERKNGLVDDVNELKESVDDAVDIILPDTIYAMVGKELNIYYDTLFKAMDNGLNSPFGYYVEIDCSTLWTKSIRRDRCWQIASDKLTSAEIGNHDATINVYNRNAELVGTKDFIICVKSADGLSLSKNILLIGDSLTANGSLAKRVAERVSAIGIAPNMVGTQLKDGYYSEGRAGWNTDTFVSKSASGYHIFQVALDANVSLNDVYSDGTTNYTIQDIRSESETKALRCTGSNDAVSTSGTLTKVSGSGDSTISFNDYMHENGNPFWNESTNALDFTNYRNNIGLSSSLDVIVVMLGVNDCMDSTRQLPRSVANIQTLIASALVDSPSCKIIVELPTIDANTISSWQAYGSVRSKVAYQKMIWKLRQLMADTTWGSNVILGSASFMLDRYYGYPYTTTSVGDRISETEIMHTNSVHPSDSGYNQIADSYLMDIMAIIG